MRLKLRLSHKGIILVAIPLVFELGLLSTMLVLLHRAEEDSRKATHFQSVTAEMNNMLTCFHEAATTFVRYRIDNNDGDRNNFVALIEKLKAHFRSLYQLAGDDKMQVMFLERIEPAVYQTIDNLGHVTHFQGNELLWERSAPAAVKSTLERLNSDLEQLIEYQTKVLKANPADEARSRALLENVMLGGVVFNVVLATWLALLVTRGMTRRIRSLTENAERFAAGQPLLPSAPGDDEIARLDEAFHSMANALAEAADKERAIIDNAADVIVSIDKSGRILQTSPASKAALGYMPDQLKEMDFSRVIAPSDLQRVTAIIDGAKGGAATAPFECLMLRADASEVSMLWSTQWVEHSQMLICVLHDITERKMQEDLLRANESRIRSIVDKMSVGLLIVSDSLKIESVNPRMEELSGYRPDELVGTQLNKLFPDTTEFNAEPSGAGMRQMTSGRVMELSATKKDGSTLPIELTVSEFESVEGHSFLLNLLDISERYEVERLKKEFVTMVSHDLRAPLLVVSDAMKELASGVFGELEEKGVKTIVDAEREIGRLIQLTNDLLDVTRMDEGKLEVQMTNIDVASILQRSAAAVRGLAKQRNITIHMPDTNFEIVAHSDRLVQVLVNLLSNAIKFSADGGEISVAVRRVSWKEQSEESETEDAVQTGVEVRVKDEGRGIPKDRLETIFQRFEQVKASDATKKGGVGLGLAICKSIIEAHRGMIGVESTEGKGSTFWFRIRDVQTTPSIDERGPSS
jgi:PAS domain S-box-containing protein